MRKAALGLLPPKPMKKEKQAIIGGLAGGRGLAGSFGLGILKGVLLGVIFFIIEGRYLLFKNGGSKMEKGKQLGDKLWMNGFLGFLGFLGFEAFKLHEPWYLFYFCFFAFFAHFKYLKEELKYLGLLGIIGLVIAILGVIGMIEV